MFFFSETDSLFQSMKLKSSNDYCLQKKKKKMQLQTNYWKLFHKKNAKYVIQIIVWSIERCHYPYKLYTFSF